MLKEFSFRAAYIGLLVSFVGFSSSFAIVLAGLAAIGADQSQAATGLFFATLAMGVGSIWLPAITRIPAAVAWSTPGAAFLAASVLLPGGFGEAVGGLLFCAVLILLTGIVPQLGRVVAAIPKPVANALLAGVLLKLCLAPALALGEIPLLVLPVIIAWVLGLMWNRLLATPMAVIAFVVVLLFTSDFSSLSGNAQVFSLPDLTPIMPQFTPLAFISLGLPLYLVTMAGQNIPGFAILELHDYPVNRQSMLRKTGIISLFIVPFGSVPINMSAITAGMMIGEDAGPNPATRYWAAISSGVVYIVLTFCTGAVVAVASLAPPALMTSVAGLALIPALVKSLSAAFENSRQLEAPALTFLITASGMTLLGVSGAFWGIVIGASLWALKSRFGREA